MPGVRDGPGAEGAGGVAAGECSGVPGVRAADRGALPPAAGRGVHGACVCARVCVYACRLEGATHIQRARHAFCQSNAISSLQPSTPATSSAPASAGSARTGAGPSRTSSCLCPAWSTRCAARASATSPAEPCTTWRSPPRGGCVRAWLLCCVPLSRWNLCWFPLALLEQD